MPEELKIKSVTIVVKTEFVDGNVSEHEFVYDNIRLSQQYGVRRFINKTTGQAMHIEPNGHEFLMLSAWKGCKSLDKFVAEEQVEFGV